MNAIECVVLGGATLLLLNFSVKEARGGNFIVLREGTPVAVKLTGDFDAAAVKEGGKVPMAVAERVKSEGYVLIDTAAPVEARFMPGKGEAKGVGRLKISSAQAVDGQDVMLRASPEVAEKDEDDAAWLRSISIPEGNRRMSAGTIFKVYLSDSYFVEE